MTQDCIFCKIAKGEIPSYKIYESKNFVVVLDINPASKGHLLIISKNHDKIGDDLGKVINKVLSLKEKLNFKMYSLIKRPEIEHFVLQFVPIYEGNEAICQVNNKPGKKEELEELVKKLKIEEKKVIEETNTKTIELPKPKEVKWNKVWMIKP